MFIIFIRKLFLISFCYRAVKMTHEGHHCQALCCLLVVGNMLD